MYGETRTVLPMVCVSFPSTRPAEGVLTTELVRPPQTRQTPISLRGSW
jgi:hypothetical protein